MKTIFKKNQLIITALAVMIAIAGYLKYSDGMADSEKIAASTTAVENQTEEELATDLSAEDIYASSGIGEESLTEIASLDDDGTAAEVETSSGTAEETPGEAVLTSSGVTVNANFASEAKLNREQTRSKNKESLLEIINSTAVSDAQKQTAIDQMLEMTTTSERETGSETLLSAKGFEDVVVSISEGKVDVVVNQSQVSDAQRAQIEDIITRKTGIAADHIVITPVQVEE